MVISKMAGLSGGPWLSNGMSRESWDHRGGRGGGAQPSKVIIMRGGRGGGEVVHALCIGDRADTIWRGGGRLHVG